MSNHKYTKSTNPFYDEEEEETDSVWKNSRTSSSNSNVKEQSFKHQIEEKTLESSKQSLRLLKESERIGTSTGAELARQRKQLETTEEHLDSINNTLDSSQKHINGIKSVFGSLKKGMFGKRIKTLKRSKTTTNSINSVEEMSSNSTVQSCELSTPLSLDIPPPTRDFQSKLDENLKECLNITSSLKNWARDVEEDINSQNDLIDRITNKTDQAQSKIEQQNKQMLEILKK